MKRLAHPLALLFLIVLSSLLEVGCQSTPPVTANPSTQFNSSMPAGQRAILAKRKAAEAAEP